MINKYYLHLLFIVFFSLSLKWLLSISEFGLNLNSLILFNLRDTQYFPIIYSIADLNFSPTYLNSVHADKIIGFPLLGVLVHSLLFSQIGIYSFIILEYIFQIIFLIIIFKVFVKVFEENKKSLYFVICLIMISSIVAVLSIYQQNIIFQNLHSVFDNNFGTRFPRPLISGILIFLIFYYILDFHHQLNKSPDNTYIIKISIILGLLINTFFYYFIIFSILLTIIFLININKKLFSNKNFKKFLLFLSILSIVASPFIFQQIYSEPEYSIRIGLIHLDNENKYYLVSYFLKKLISLKFSSITIIAFIFFCYSNYFLKNICKKMNIFFYFIISSILSTIFFIIFSPGIISIYHFADIIMFSLIFYLFIGVFIIIYDFVEKSKFSKKLINNKMIIFLTLTFLIFDGFYVFSDFNKKKEPISETIKLEKFLDDENLLNTKHKLFSNDRTASNIWLLKNNNNLLISDGFTNSLKNSQIEYNLINNLKYFGFSNKMFKDFISLGQSEVRNNFFLRLFIYRYQANSLHTYSNIRHYTEDFQNEIKSLSPFRAQSQIIPEDEKERLLELFLNHSIDKNLVADYVIINFSNISEHFKILNKEYNEIFSSKNYKVYSR